MIDLESMTLGDIRKFAASLAPFLTGGAIAAAPEPYPIPLGTLVTVETILPHYVGTLDLVTPTTIVLSRAAWVSDTGRWSEFAKDTKEAKEVEPLPESVPLCIERSAIISVRVQIGANLTVAW